MADEEVIQSFLISLGFKLDSSQQAKFDAAMKSSRARGEEFNKTISDVGKQLGILGDKLVSLAGEPTRKAEDASDRINKRHIELMKNTKQLGLLAVTTAGAYVTSFTEIARQYENLYYVQQRTGVSVQQLAAFRYAGPQVGLGAGDLQQAQEALAQATRNPGLKALVESWGVASNDLEGIIKHLAALPPFLQDAYAGMLGISTTTMRNLINNQATFDQAQADFNKRAKDYAIDYGKTAKDATQIARDLGTVWSQVEMIGVQAFSETYPYIHSLLIETEKLLDLTGKFNASHPGAASAEAGATATAGAYGVGRLVGLIPGLGAIGSLAKLIPGLAAWWTFGQQVGPYVKPNDIPYRPGMKMGEYFDRPKFAQGGIVPVDAHAGEIILPQSLSAMLLQAAGGGGSANNVSELLRSWLYGTSSYQPLVRVVNFDPSAPGNGGYAPSDQFGQMVSPGGGRPGGSGSGPGASANTNISGASAKSLEDFYASSTINDPNIRAASAAIAMRESRFKDVNNYMYRVWGHDKNGTPLGYTASGYYQMLASNWHRYGQGVVDFSKYPEARGAPRELQDSVFAAMYRKEGYRPWDSTHGGSIAGDNMFYGLTNKILRSHPTSTAAGGGSRGDVSLTHNPILHLHGSADDMATKVMATLNRYSGRFIRNAQAAIN